MPLPPRSGRIAASLYAWVDQECEKIMKTLKETAQAISREAIGDELREADMRVG